MHWHGYSWHLRALLPGVPNHTYPLTARHSPEDILRDKQEQEHMGNINVQIGNELGVLVFLGPHCTFDFLIAQNKNHKTHPAR